MNFQALDVGRKFPARRVFGSALASHIAAAVDSRLGGKSAASALSLFDTITHDDEGPFERNASFWGADLAAKFSCASPSNATGNHLRAVTAITPRHCIACKHGGAASYPADGATIRFVDANDNVVVRTQSEHLEFTQLDFAVILLDEDLPASIVPPKMWPNDALPYLPWNARVPVIVLDQQEKGVIHELESRYPGQMNFVATEPGNAARAEFYETLVAGDSGNPFFVIVNDELVLVSVISSDTTGPSPEGHIATMNAAIVAVDALGSVSTGYTATPADFSGFNTL